MDVKLDVKSIGGGILVAIVVLVAIFKWNGCPTKPTVTKDSSALEMKWEFSATGPITAALALSEDGTLYAGSEDGFLYALDSTGTLQWKFYAGPIMAAPTIGPDGTVYVTNRRGRVFALNSTGTQQWQVDTYDGETWGKTGGAINSSYFYAPTRDGLCAIGLNDGTIRWKAGIGFDQYGSVTLLPNGVLVFPSRGRLEAANSDGETIWQYPEVTDEIVQKNGGFPPPGNTFFTSGIAWSADGTIMGSGGGAKMIALGSDGTYKWSFQTKGTAMNRATPVIAADSTIYEGSADSFLYAVNSDGSQKWAFDTKGSIIATPILAEDGTVFVIGGSTLWEVSANGAALGHTRLPNGVESSPTLGTDGTVYVATNQGKVMAYGAKHGGLMNSPWPKFQRDGANSGRAH